MAVLTQHAMKKDFGSPEEVREFEKQHFAVVRLGDRAIGYGTFEPGWRWSQHVGSVTGGKRCQVRHETYVISGRMHIALADGSEMELKPGDVALIPEDHDAWVVGDERAELIDFGGDIASYAQK